MTKKELADRKKAKKSFYNSKIWKWLRIDAIIENPMCFRCKVLPTLAIDHTIPFLDKHDEFATDSDNLIGLCHSCHGEVTGPEEWKYRDYYLKGYSYKEIRNIKYRLVNVGLDGYQIPLKNPGGHSE